MLAGIRVMSSRQLGAYLKHCSNLTLHIVDVVYNNVFIHKGYVEYIPNFLLLSDPKPGVNTV